MRILIVEDEPKTASFLQKGLGEQGYSVDHADNGEQGLFLAKEQFYNLIILDVMLPKLDGFSIIKEVRCINPHVCILFLTARGNLDDKVKGFELGADDYLIKPFSFSELLARVRALLKRGAVTLPEKIVVADLELDLLKHQAMRNTRRLHLSPKEFALLVFFAQHPGEVLSRTLIAERVWDINFDNDSNVIDVAVRRLRQKVDVGFSKELIHTVRGVGYVFEER